MFSLIDKIPWQPDEIVAGIGEIDYDLLKKRGIKSLFYDVDNTLLSCSARCLENDCACFLRTLQQNHGFRICLISNTLIPCKEKRIKRIAKSIKSSFVCCSLFRQKPNPWGYLRAMLKTEADSCQCAMIGDQIFTDIVGANRLGIYTILVKPLGRDTWITYLTLRRFGEIPLRRRLMTDELSKNKES